MKYYYIHWRHLLCIISITNSSTRASVRFVKLKSVERELQDKIEVFIFTGPPVYVAVSFLHYLFKCEIILIIIQNGGQ